MFNVSSSKRMSFSSLILSFGSLRAHLIVLIIISIVAVTSSHQELKLVDNSILQNIQEESQLRNSSTTSEGLFNTTNNASSSSIFHDLDINSVIKLFESTLKNRSVDNNDDDDDNNNKSIQLRITAATNGSQDEQVLNRPQTQLKKLIRSRYRSRVVNPNESSTSNSPNTSFNYSQPFDNSPISQQVALGRALSVPVVTSRGSVAPDSPVAYSSYLATHSQRAPIHSAAAAELPSATVSNSVSVVGSAANSNGRQSNSASLVLDEPTSYNQENLLDYTPPLQQTTAGHYSQSMPSLNRLYTTTGRSRGSPQSSLPYFLASPSIGYSDFYGNGNGDHHTSSSDYISEHYIPRSMLSNSHSSSGGGNNNNNNNFTDHHLNYESSPAFASSIQFPPSTDFSHPYSPSSSFLGRSRWSWPWADVSSLTGTGSGFGNVLASNANPMTSATFKKHYHHHHMPAHHKEHDHHHHHEEHEHLSKWEHGISIGEIACIAIAVILGVIILGSPFFLLFLMLFNGGNIFGGTQMGLLAPAVAPGAGGGGGSSGGGSGGGGNGRRRRKRSLDNIDNKVGVGLSKKELEARLKELDLHGVGEYLFERLSPFMDADKLMRSFEKIMEVKDDIESLVTKVGLGDLKASVPFEQSSSSVVGENPESKYKHVEMRRRRKK